MINNKTIHFGYGTIWITTAINQICFSHIKEQYECGDAVNPDNTSVIQTIRFTFTYEEFIKFEELIRKVLDKEILSFEFKNYIFDFSKWNVGSVYSCLQSIDCIRQMYLVPLAC